MDKYQIAFAWSKLNSILQDSIPKEDMSIWILKFELLEINNNNIVIGYKDAACFNEFAAKYMNDIYGAAYTLCGGLVNVKFKKMASRGELDGAEFSGRNTSHTGRKVISVVLALVSLLLVVAITVVAVNFVSNLTFTEKFYTVSSDSVNESFRIIQLSDLHNTVYGKDNEKLIGRISALAPDIIVMTGDMLDQNGNVDEIVNLCGELVKIAPVFYVYGNNENTLAFDNTMTLRDLDAKFGFNDDNREPEKLYAADNGLREKIESSGAKVLFNECATVKVGSNEIDIFGTLTSNPSAFWQYAGDAYSEFYYVTNPNNFKLFLSHDPMIYETYEEEWGDLALCGDTHGGVIKLPKLGALYTRSGGILPEKNGHYVSGSYKLPEDATLIVSTGLTNQGIPRIGNSPELVVINVSRY